MFVADVAAIKVSQKLLCKDVIILCAGNHFIAYSVLQTV